MDGVRGGFLRLPHGTMPAAVRPLCSVTRASVVQWLRALTLKRLISHRCDSSRALGTCEMPGSVPVGQMVSPTPDERSARYR